MKTKRLTPMEKAQRAFDDWARTETRKGPEDQAIPRKLGASRIYGKNPEGGYGDNPECENLIKGEFNPWAACEMAILREDRSDFYRKVMLDLHEYGLAAWRATKDRGPSQRAKLNPDSLFAEGHYLWKKIAEQFEHQ